MIRKLLVANRGEIAIRVIRACRELGIAPVAVFAEPDRASRHLGLADEAHRLDGGYLAMEELWAIAQASGCDAIHPGYGFLAENAAFAEGTVARGLTWVGPHPDAIRRMGSKLEARRLATHLGVPIVPGRTEPVREAAEVVAFGAEFGYPVLVKAASGGGGRGQVVVEGPEGAQAALDKAMREGKSYFADDTVYVERYLQRPRHVEVQILGDRFGQVFHLGERDCSIQRRNQKLVEEAPSPAVGPDLRVRLGEAAVRLAQAVGYDSAGTVEFMLQDGEFYFLEMNTRIQVEHTVTEEVYNVDLVKAMIEVAGGKRLDPGIAHYRPRGWAVQIRLNAEDPSANWRPAPGLVTAWEAPMGPGIRVDGAVYAGWTIPSEYDSMIAKVIAKGATRAEALARMRRALAELKIEGVPTTLALDQHIMAEPHFQAGEATTRYLQECIDEAAWQAIQAATPAASSAEAEPVAPARRFEVEVGRQRFEVRLVEHGAPALALAGAPAGRAKPSAPGAGAKASAKPKGDPNAVVAPMQSKVVSVAVKVGDEVAAGQPLVVVEAMKMESELPSPRAGTVKAVHCAEGDTVASGQSLVELA